MLIYFIILFFIILFIFSQTFAWKLSFSLEVTICNDLGNNFSVHHGISILSPDSVNPQGPPIGNPWNSDSFLTSHPEDYDNGVQTQ